MKIENKTVTTWWLIEDVDYHMYDIPREDEYVWCHMIDEYNYTEEKFRFTEPKYDEISGKLCSFWLKVEMPKYLWHLDQASMYTKEHKDKRSEAVYDFCKNITDSWVETKRLEHKKKNESFYNMKKKEALI